MTQMSYGPEVAMPGAFYFETPQFNGVQPGIFKPPGSPTLDSSTHLAKSTGSLYSDTGAPASNIKRKRQRAAKESTPLNDWTVTGESAMNIGALEEDVPEAGRRRSLVERRYVLAGQIETPGTAAQKELGEGMDDSVYSDVDYRRAMGSKRNHDEVDSPLSRYTTADSTLPRPSQGTPGWTGAFRGFYAGGGAGYAMTTGTAPPSQSASGQIWCNEHDIPTLPYGASTFSPVPGGFPESDYAPFCYEREDIDSSPQPAAKRRQVSDTKQREDLGRNWVMVNEPQRQSSFASRPSNHTGSSRAGGTPHMHRRINKPVSRLSTPTMARKQSSRVSHAGAASLSTREPASFASPRSSSSLGMRPETPFRLPVASRPQSPSNFSSRFAAQPTRIPSPSPFSQPAQTRRRTHSNASPVAGRPLGRRDSALDIEENSPRLSDEARRLAVRRLQQEEETDLQMNDFNARLQAMIRQGKEALGTTIEVEDMDGGWVDD